MRQGREERGVALNNLIRNDQKRKPLAKKKKNRVGNLKLGNEEEQKSTCLANFGNVPSIFAAFFFDFCSCKALFYISVKKRERQEIKSPKKAVEDKDENNTNKF